MKCFQFEDTDFDDPHWSTLDNYPRWPKLCIQSGIRTPKDQMRVWHWEYSYVRIANRHVQNCGSPKTLVRFPSSKIDKIIWKIIEIYWFGGIRALKHASTLHPVYWYLILMTVRLAPVSLRFDCGDPKVGFILIDSCMTKYVHDIHRKETNTCVSMIWVMFSDLRRCERNLLFKSILVWLNIAVYQWYWAAAFWIGQLRIPSNCRWT